MYVLIKEDFPTLQAPNNITMRKIINLYIYILLLTC